jgi:hypothetical protein
VLVAVALRTLPGFELAIRAMIAHYTEETAYHDQKEMMGASKKPYHMGVKEFATRMAFIMIRMTLLPGAPAAGTPPYNAEEHKVLFERAMPDHWRTEWNRLALNILDPAITLTRIVSFFIAQEREELKQRARLAAAAAAARGGRGGRQYRGGRGQPYRQPALLPYHQGGRTWVPAAAAAPAPPPGIYAGHSRGRGGRGFGGRHHAAGRGAGRGRGRGYGGRGRGYGARGGRGYGGRSPVVDNHAYYESFDDSYYGSLEGHYGYTGNEAASFAPAYDIVSGYGGHGDAPAAAAEVPAAPAANEGYWLEAPAPQGGHWVDDSFGVHDGYDYSQQGRTGYGDY